MDRPKFIPVEARFSSEPNIPRVRKKGPGSPHKDDLPIVRTNPVTDFVLAHVDSYSELNARTAAESAKIFNKKMAEAISQYQGDEVIETGAVYRVYTIKPRPEVEAVPEAGDLVVGRFRAVGYGETLSEIDSSFNGIQREHQMVLDYFGPRHTPHTEFVMLEGVQFAESNPDEFRDDTEHLMVQEMLYGSWYSITDRDAMRSAYVDADKYTDELRAEGDSYAEAYHRMQTERLTVPEHQMVIDVEGNNIFNGDTNHPYIFRHEIDNNSYLRSRKVDPETIQHPRDLHRYLTQNVERLHHLADVPWEEARNALYSGSILELEIEHEMNAAGESWLVSSDFNNLITMLDLFPPDESENRVIRQLRDIGLASRVRPEASRDAPSAPDEVGAITIAQHRSPSIGRTPHVEGRGNGGTAHDLSANDEDSSNTHDQDSGRDR